MTAAEADQKAAADVLDLIARDSKSYVAIGSRRDPAVQAAFDRIETWLRRRAVGGDRILTRQMERPTGRQVGMSPKKARKLGIPEK